MAFAIQRVLLGDTNAKVGRSGFGLVVDIKMKGRGYGGLVTYRGGRLSEREWV